jgi:hypothetical protein
MMLLRRSALLAVFFLLVAGCASDFVKQNQTQIDAYIQAHPDLPEYDKQCIYDGRFEIGIKQETLEFMLGKPPKLETIKQPWAVQERWIYSRKGQKIFVIEDKHVVGILEKN